MNRSLAEQEPSRRSTHATAAQARPHVSHHRADQPSPDIVPPQAPQCSVIAGVVAVATEVRHVDPANERDLAIDHDSLLMVAVKRMLTGIKLTADLRLADQPLHALAHLRPRGMKDRHRCPGPHQNPNVDALSHLGEQRSQDRQALATHQLKLRRDVPAGDVNEFRGDAIASAIAAIASFPSISTSTAQPSRGGGSPCAQVPGLAGINARDHPRRRRRRACFATTAASTRAPTAASSRAVRA